VRSGDKDKKPDSLADRASYPGVFWEAHQCDLPYVQIDRPVNLGSLPPFGFRVASFPLKIQNGSAGPTRAVAILPEGSGVVPPRV
jgi:kynurenine formamidase